MVYFFAAKMHFRSEWHCLVQRRRAPLRRWSGASSAGRVGRWIIGSRSLRNKGTFSRTSGRLALDCLNSDFRNKMLVGKLLTRFIWFISFYTSAIATFRRIFVLKGDNQHQKSTLCTNFVEIFANFLCGVLRFYEIAEERYKLAISIQIS